MRDYVRDFAILNTGGKGVVMALRQPDLSKAIMPRDDFEFLYRKDWFEVVGEDGSIPTIYPAKRFLAKPPKNAQVYLGGFVFKPSGRWPPTNTISTEECLWSQIHPARGRCCTTSSVRSGRKVMRTLPRGFSNI